MTAGRGSEVGLANSHLMPRSDSASGPTDGSFRAMQQFGLDNAQPCVDRRDAALPLGEKFRGPPNARRHAVFANPKIGSALVALACIAVAPSASAVTAEVAKKCSASAAEAFPPREVGNPAAGLAKGT